MGTVHDIEAYRFYKIVKLHLEANGIECNFKYNDPFFTEWTHKFEDDKCSWAEFFTEIGAYAMCKDEKPQIEKKPE